jgi:hypothetical protein
MRWHDIEFAQPTLAAKLHDAILVPGVTLIGTVRKDGTPRISPIEPLVLDGDLQLSMMHGSRKANDLVRDPRILVHSIVTNRDGEDGETKLRGTAIAMDDNALHQRYAEAVARDLGWQPEVGHFHLFRIDIATVDVLWYRDGDQFHTAWPAGTETVRRKRTPTDLHPSEPTSQLLIPS